MDWRTKPPFKVLYEDVNITVFTNGSGEIFVDKNGDGPQIRIAPDLGGLTVTAANWNMTPYSKNGLPAIVVR